MLLIAWIMLALNPPGRRLVNLVTALLQGDLLAWGILLVCISLGGGVTWRTTRRRRFW